MKCVVCREREAIATRLDGVIFNTCGPCEFNWIESRMSAAQIVDWAARRAWRFAAKRYRGKARKR